MELESILTHEIIHAMEKDIWYKLIYSLASSIHWFNPLSYLLVQQAETDLEYYCDWKVVEIKDYHTEKNIVPVFCI